MKWIVVIICVLLTGCSALLQVGNTESGTIVHRYQKSWMGHELALFYPELIEALPAAGFDVAHSMGFKGFYYGTNVPVRVFVLDSFLDIEDYGDNSHGDKVVDIIHSAAPHADIYMLEIFGDEEFVVSELYFNALSTVRGMVGGSSGGGVLNLSIGDRSPGRACNNKTEYGRKEQAFMRDIWERGVTVVASAGNAGVGAPAFDRTSAPACWVEPISVGSVYDESGVYTSGFPFFEDQISAFSSFGQIYAPGSHIISEKSTGTDGQEEGPNGTSWAAPLVSAAAALLQSITPDVFEAEAFLKNGARRVKDIWWGTDLSYLVLDAGNSLRLLAKTRDIPFGEEPPRSDDTLPPQTQKSIPEALDVNKNLIIDNDELQAAIQFWVTGEPVPETGGQIIDEVAIRLIIALWITELPYRE